LIARLLLNLLFGSVVTVAAGVVAFGVSVAVTVGEKGPDFVIAFEGADAVSIEFPVPEGV
jgi:hypothetical protein